MVEGISKIIAARVEPFRIVSDSHYLIAGGKP
jgi:hypothetical protein